MNRFPGVVSEIHVAGDFASGVRELASLIRPAYGASARFVASAGQTGGSVPELLQDGATIAQRLTALDRRVDNVGAMYLRGVLQQIQDLGGDGSSTGALIFEAVLASGSKAIAAGHNPARLRDSLLNELDTVLDALRSQRFVPRTRDDLRRLAKSVSGDLELETELATVVDILGQFGSIEVRPGRGEQFGFEWLDEPYWPTRPLENAQLPPFGLRAEATSCAVFVSDLELETAADGVALLEAARARGASSLLVIARSCSAQCQHVLLANASAENQVLLVATPGTSIEQGWESVADIAVMTGARQCHAAAGDTVAVLTGDDLGMCRRVWMTRTHVGLIGGAGDCRTLMTHVAELTARYHAAEHGTARDRLRLRRSRITGRSAVLWINGVTDREVALNRARAERTCQVMQRALAGGVVPGGGAALITCERRLSHSQETALEPEERAATMALRQGLRAPVLALAENAGLHQEVTVSQLEQDGGHGIDIGLGRVVCAEALPVLDSFDAIDTAVRLAVSGAAQALTIGAIVFPRAVERGMRS